jgi:Holliday junction resolvase RusA-like endonuclease
LSLLLPSLKIPSGRLALKIVFGVSNPRCDLDNLLKGTIDGMMAKYHFDDHRIYSLWARKDIVPRGDEFIDFSIGAAR